MKKKEVIKEIVEMGSEMTGNVSGSVLGTLVAGPLGLVVAGVGGVAITKLFKTIGSQIQERMLSSREVIRIGAVYTFALNKINQNEKEGRLLRNDDFFSERKNERPISEEILEGIILTAQKEYEEKKIKFLGNLYGNICTNMRITNEQAYQLIRITESLTYRQFCLLALYFKKEKKESLLFGYKLSIDPRYKEDKEKASEKRRVPFDLIAEVKDLTQKGLLHTVNTFANKDGFNFSSFNITSGGKFYYEILELQDLEQQYLIALDQFVNICDPPGNKRSYSS